MSEQALKSLRQKVASLQNEISELSSEGRRRRSARRRRSTQPESTQERLSSEIEELENRITAMPYMQDDLLDDDDDWMDDDDDDDDDLMDDLLDDDDDDDWMGDDDELFCRASETSPGVEDRITQDYLSEVEGEAHGRELATVKSIKDASLLNLRSASEKLDRVADYLEGTGRKKAAFKIDKVSDNVDSRIVELMNQGGEG